VQSRPGGAMNLTGSGYNFFSQLIRIHKYRLPGMAVRRFFGSALQLIDTKTKNYFQVTNTSYVKVV
jgi:hypothetical protein